MANSTINSGGMFNEISRMATIVIDTILNGAHAAPVAGATGIASVPSRHRLYNAAGGIGGWVLGRYLMNILVGENPQGKKIEREHVILPLRPLHGILAYNRYADDPTNQWMRVIDDLAPAIIGSLGAVLGSKYFFHDKEKKYFEAVRWAEHSAPSQDNRSPLERMLADERVSVADKAQFMGLLEAQTWRVLSGVSGVFAASSGMALLALPFNIFNYGVSLNNAFSLANGATPGGWLFKKVPFLNRIYNTVSNTPYGPSSAVSTLIKNVSNCTAEMEAIGQILTTENITNQNMGRITELTDALIRKLFTNVTQQHVDAFKASVVGAIERAVNDTANPQPIAQKVKHNLEALLMGQNLNATINGIDSALLNNLKFNERSVNGLAGWIGSHPKMAYGAAAGAVGTAIAVTAITKDKTPHNTFTANEEKPRQSTGIMGFINGPVLRFARWLSDAVIAVPPKNRVFSALGLTGGLWVGYRGMRLLAGKEYDGSSMTSGAIGHVTESFAGKILKPLIGIFNFNYFTNGTADRWKRVVFWAVPTITGAIGIYLGSKFAFRDKYKKLERPEYLEEYTAKIALTQGDKWGILAATGGVMASSSGFSNLPIPGLNYGIGLASRTVLSYDKRVSSPFLGKFWSNNDSRYYQGLAALQDYTILYCARNPSRHPDEIPALAHAILSPLFDNETPEHYQALTRKIESVRNKYWQPGGVPKESQEVLSKELRAILTKGGFEQTLEEIGLNPADVIFNNGMAGKIANTIGARKKVEKLGDEYREKYEARKMAREKTGASHGPTIDEKASVFAQVVQEGPAPVPENMKPFAGTSAQESVFSDKYAKAPQTNTYSAKNTTIKNTTIKNTGRPVYSSAVDRVKSQAIPTPVHIG